MTKQVNMKNGHVENTIHNTKKGIPNVIEKKNE